MKKSDLNQELKIPVFNDEYSVIFCWGEEKKIKKVLRSWGHKTKDVNLLDFRGQTFYTKDCHPVIAMPKFPVTPEQIGTLAHEATHAINNIFDKIGAFKDDELFAHSIGAVVRQVLKHK